MLLRRPSAARCRPPQPGSAPRHALPTPTAPPFHSTPPPTPHPHPHPTTQPPNHTHQAPRRCYSGWAWSAGSQRWPLQKTPRLQLQVGMGVHVARLDGLHAAALPACPAPLCQLAGRPPQSPPPPPPPRHLRFRLCHHGSPVPPAGKPTSSSLLLATIRLDIPHPPPPPPPPPPHTIQPCTSSWQPRSCPAFASTQPSSQRPALCSSETTDRRAGGGGAQRACHLACAQECG